ncbi:hypothetical protein [Halorussus sp. MSC15.2]|uniref:DUF7535 family protein n=1 Tax=Halorussus sp. MSC15.2 TaxID=2283638 RepID=UPI0013D53718|nr:hypothetical protein [Halorussus sp. MSC15.2]NEU57756.1 hypothetical protein [Halorussus sp. MSC15.2]
MTGQVSRMQGQTTNSQMGTVGYIVAAGVAIVLLPVLPLVLLLWLLAESGDRNERETPHTS